MHVEITDIKSIDPDVRSVIYCAGMRDASIDLWNSFWTNYTNSESDSEKSVILKNLACSENDEIIKGYVVHMIYNELTFFLIYLYIIFQLFVESSRKRFGYNRN